MELKLKIVWWFEVYYVSVISIQVDFWVFDTHLVVFSVQCSNCSHGFFFFFIPVWQCDFTLATIALTVCACHSIKEFNNNNHSNEEKPPFFCFFHFGNKNTVAAALSNDFSLPIASLQSNVISCCCCCYFFLFLHLVDRFYVKYCTK